MASYGEMLTSFDRCFQLYSALGRPRAEARESLVQAFYNDAAERRDSFPLAHLCVELAFSDDFRPSYQISGPLCSALQETRLDLDPSLVHFPHRSFALELPLEGEGVIRDPATGRRLLAALVGSFAVLRPRARRRDGVRESVVCRLPEEGPWSSLIVQRWEGEDRIDPPAFISSYRPGATIASSVEDALLAPHRESPNTRSDGGVRADQDTLRKVVRLAIGSALFAVAANSQFTKPVREPRARKRRREREQFRGREPAVGDEEVRRWRLGASIQLPGKARSSSAPEADSSRGLTFAHVRQGHLRLQRLGREGDYKYVMKYIRPTIVRPDLAFPVGYQASKHRIG